MVGNDLFASRHFFRKVLSPCLANFAGNGSLVFAVNKIRKPVKLSITADRATTAPAWAELFPGLKGGHLENLVPVRIADSSYVGDMGVLQQNCVQLCEASSGLAIPNGGSPGLCDARTASGEIPG